MSEIARQDWRKRISRLRRRVNRVILLEASSLPLGIVLSIAATAFYMARRMDISFWWAGVFGAGLILGTVVWAYYRSRKCFFSDRDTRAYLDQQLGLYSALSADLEMNVSLPPFPEERIRCLKRKSWSPFYPLASGVILLIASWSLPLPDAENPSPIPVSLPPALEQVAEWIDEAEKTPEIAEESIEEFQQQMAELLKKSREEMYSHSGLEAADAMKEKVKNASAEMYGNLGDLSQSLNDMMSSASSEQNALALQALDKALSAMEQSKLGLGGQLGEKLKEMNASAMSNLNPEQLQQLQQQFKNAGKCMNALCKNALGAALDDIDGEKYTSMCLGGGSPGTGKGGGEAPLSFRKDGDEKIGGRAEAIASNDMSRAALGDQLGVKTGEHEVDENANSSPTSSKASSSAADGGNSVWMDELTPAERDALKGVFN